MNRVNNSAQGEQEKNKASCSSSVVWCVFSMIPFFTFSLFAPQAFLFTHPGQTSLSLYCIFSFLFRQQRKTIGAAYLHDYLLPMFKVVQMEGGLNHCGLKINVKFNLPNGHTSFPEVTPRDRSFRTMREPPPFPSPLLHRLSTVFSKVTRKFLHENRLMEGAHVLREERKFRMTTFTCIHF